MGIRTTLWRILYGLLLENKPPKLKKSPFDEKFTLELLPDLMDVDHVEFPKVVLFFIILFSMVCFCLEKFDGIPKLQSTAKRKKHSRTAVSPPLPFTVHIYVLCCSKTVCKL